jgi:hypothetical protein
VGIVHLFDRFILHADNNMFVSERSAEMSIPIKHDLGIKSEDEIKLIR